MPFAAEDIRANRDSFANKLRAEKQKNDVIKWVKGEPGTAVPRRLREGPHLGGLLRASRGARRDRFAVAPRPGAGHVLLERHLTPERRGGSAVGRAGVLREGDERRVGRVDGGRAADAFRPGREGSDSLRVLEVA